MISHHPCIRIKVSRTKIHDAKKGEVKTDRRGHIMEYGSHQNTVQYNNDPNRFLRIV
jgi:hypothetical protein